MDKAIEEGVAFLLKSQNADGSWGTGAGTTGFDVMATVPGSHDAFRVATTALCVMALRETGEKESSARGLDYLVKYDGLRRANTVEIYNCWGHTYALQALARAYREDKVEDYKKAAERHLEYLEKYETVVGGWNYYDFEAKTQTPSMEPTSFGTAAGLAALYEAKEAGIEVPQPLIQRALRRLREMRKPDGFYLYGGDYRYIPMLWANREKGSIGRTQAANYALNMWNYGGIGEKELSNGLDAFFGYHRFLDMGRKRQYPHEAWYQTSGYYYYFGHYYAARIIEKLADKKDYREKLKRCVLPYQEENGSWWDYYMYDYHEPYGTAYAIMILLRCR